MEALIHVDTHVLVWLYAGDVDRFPPEARRRIELCRIVASPIAALELQYLHEVRRLTEPAAIVMQDLSARIGLEVDDVSVRELVANAQHMSFTRDPFDRLIVAHADLRAAPLLTADKTLLRVYDRALWTRARR